MCVGLIFFFVLLEDEQKIGVGLLTVHVYCIIYWYIPTLNVLNVGCQPNVGRQNVISDCGFRGNFGDICPILVSISEVIYII